MKKISKNKLLAFICAAFLSVAVTGCASAPQTAGGEVYDPLENMNRAVSGFNDAVDQAVAEPLARGYRAVTPKLFREGVTNFLRNLRSPVNVANQILQGDIEGAAGDVSRFAMNTTIGVGGLFDVAAGTGLEYEEEDFGQTLGVWGVGNGPYLVLPLLGPSTLRDASGLAVDAIADPVRLYLFNTDEENWYFARAGVTALSKREALLDALDDLRANSFDYYAAMRSAYMQKREAMLRDDNPGLSSAPAIPDYDDEDGTD